MVVATPTSSQSNPVADWFKKLPPVTRAWFLLTFLNANFVYFGVVSPQSIAWSSSDVVSRFHVWKLLTPFTFIGTWGQSGFSTLIGLYMLQQYSSRMELSPPNTGGGGTTADYLFLLLIVAALQLLSTLLVPQFFLGASLYFAVLYIWCKTNHEQQVSIWGFPMKAAVFPFALIALHLATGSDYMSDIVGLVTGHCYFFLQEVYPIQSGKDVLRTPDFLVRLCHRLQVGGGYVAPGAPAAAAGGIAPPGRVRPPAAGGIGGGHQWG
ncbi:hypothetical protein TeGR_g11823, partial [Tetraparma gracilis]